MVTWKKKEPFYKMDSTEWIREIKYGLNKEKTGLLFIKKKPNWRDYYWQMWLGMRQWGTGSAPTLQQAKTDAVDSFNCKVNKKCDKK